MATYTEDIEEFHERFKHTYQDYPRPLERDEKAFRITCLREEIEEYASANSLEEEFDGLIDLVYFALGTAYRHGFDFERGWQRVHAANMLKVNATKATDSKRGSTLDIVKPKGWIAPDLTDIVYPKPNPCLVSQSGGVYAKKRKNLTKSQSDEIIKNAVLEKGSKRVNLPPAEG